PAELLEVLDRGKDEEDLAPAMGVERRLRLEPGGVHRLRSVRTWLGARGDRGEEEARVEADAHLRRCYPARERDQGRRIVQRDVRLLGQLAQRRGPVGGVALARLAGVHRPAREP